MTKKEQETRIKNFLQQKLATDRHWATRALVVIFNRQTSDEIRNEETKELNYIGFTGADAEILTSFAKQWLSRNWLSEKQMIILHRRIVRYWRQLWDASDKVKLEEKIGSPVQLSLYDEDKVQ